VAYSTTDYPTSLNIPGDGAPSESGIADFDPGEYGGDSHYWGLLDDTGDDIVTAGVAYGMTDKWNDYPRSWCVLETSSDWDIFNGLLVLRFNNPGLYNIVWDVNLRAVDSDLTLGDTLMANPPCLLGGLNAPLGETIMFGPTRYPLLAQTTDQLVGSWSGTHYITQGQVDDGIALGSWQGQSTMPSFASITAGEVVTTVGGNYWFVSKLT